MIRINLQPRNAWQQKVEELGFGFHSTEGTYWDESAAYIFKLKEIEAIEAATNKIWEMCLSAVQYVIDNKLYTQFAIPSFMIPYIEKSWNDDVPSIYGRLDLGFANGQIKLLEFNADTPTSLYEAGIIQWFWLQEFDAKKDQFNSIHEKLIAYWKYLKPYLHEGILYFSCVKESLEDLTNVEYLRDCAMQAGLETKLIFIDEIGWDSNIQQFVDVEDECIKNIFKLYPWEWLANEAFGQNIVADKNNTHWIEPAWKMLLSNKAILTILWNLFPNHEYLLQTNYMANGMTNYVKKPLLSREGANVSIIKENNLIEETKGEYGEEGYVFQEYMNLENEFGFTALIGSWIIGGEASGIGIRESKSKITDNTSRFVPHYIEH
jgi:glutathionylspermidine synthase